MIKAQRYLKENKIYTNQNVLEELLNYTSIFKSKDYVKDVLSKVHGFKNKTEIEKGAEEIKLYITMALDLANQAFNSKPELSYLPLYYSCLNLIKANLVVLNQRSNLQKNKRHGMHYNDSPRTRIFLNESVKFRKIGTIPLYYQTISNKIITKSQVVDIKLNDIYQNIVGISAESNFVIKKRKKLIRLKAVLHRINKKFEVRLLNHNNRRLYLAHPRTVFALKNFSLEPNGQYYKSNKLFQSRAQAQAFINNNINTYYINNFYCETCKAYHFNTFESGKSHVFNEDLSICIAIYHLSNVVRYNPMHFSRIMNSKNYPMIISLRKNGYFSLLTSINGHLRKETFEIRIKN